MAQRWHRGGTEVAQRWHGCGGSAATGVGFLQCQLTVSGRQTITLGRSSQLWSSSSAGWGPPATVAILCSCEHPNDVVLGEGR